MVHQLFLDFKEAYTSNSVRKEVLYSILIEFEEPMNNWICLNEICNKVCIGKHLSDMFPIQNGLKQADAVSPLLYNYALECAIRKV
jgi:hypothetical protein